MGRLAVSEELKPKGVNLSEDWEHTPIDTSVAHPARMYDYYLGGIENCFLGLE